VSNFMPLSCRKRQVIDVKGFKGDPAIHFKWADGSTLMEWSQTARRRADVNITARIRAAIAIVKTLVDFHQARVVYNNLSPENIVLDTFEGSYIATFIDLSKAIILSNDARNGGQVEKSAVETDLQALGQILNALFDGQKFDSYSSADDDDETSTEGEENSYRRKRKKCQVQVEGLPTCLNALISTLLFLKEGEGETSEKYGDAKDVLSDLQEIAMNPQIYLKALKVDDFTLHNRLNAPVDAFHGRQREVSLLYHAFDSVNKQGGQPMVVSISGSAGSGKTFLVNQIRKPLQEANGYLIRGKFEVRERPDSTIFFALDDFFARLIDDRRENVQDLVQRIRHAVGPGCRVLMNSIPNLQRFMDGHLGDNSDGAVGNSASEHRWKYLLCKLVAAVSSRNEPLTIFFDDLQWADETSLEVISMMITEPDIKYCLFLCTHRIEDKIPQQRIKRMLRTIQEHGVSVTSIKIGAIAKDTVNTMLSETLCLPPSLCNPLSSIIHNRTGGIILFVMNFLRSLNEEGLLWFNLSTRRWEYDIAGIQQKEVSADVVQHMSQRMARLPRSMQFGLKLCSCLGASFDVNVLRKGGPANEFDVEEFLPFSVEGGFLREDGQGRYSWANDQVQQAAYALIPVRKRDSFHLLLGSKIFMRSPANELTNIIFTIVWNMNQGIRQLKTRSQFHEVARLNLKAGKQAMASSSYDSASKYLLVGVSLLDDDSWDSEYDLSLGIYDAVCEALCVIGDHEKLSSIIQEPLRKARCCDDKLNSYHTLVRHLKATGDVRGVIEKCKNVLSELGDHFTDQVDEALFREESRRVEQLLKDKSEEELTSLPKMTNERKIASMQFLNHAVSSAFAAEPLLAPILLFKMVTLSIEYGVCEISAFAFAGYGSWLVSALKSDFQGGYRMGHVAIELNKRLGGEEGIPRLYATVYGFINIWKMPFQASLPMHLEAYEAGNFSGDVEFTVTNLYMHASNSLYGCGNNLRNVDSTARVFIRRCKQRGQDFIGKFICIIHEIALKLMGSSEKSYALFYDTTEERLFTDGREQSTISLCRFILFKRKYVAFFLGQMNAAADFFELGLSFPIGGNGRLVNIIVGVFIDGLIAFYYARKRRYDETRWTEIGIGVLNLMEVWAKASDWNFSNKLFLLRAECFFLRGDERAALQMYNASIKAAQDHRFIHEEGLAHEKLASFHDHYGRRGEALACFNAAKRCYENWGAQAVVQRVERTIPMLRR